VARRLDAGMLAPGIAYLTSDAEITSPFVQSFRVLEELPTDLKALRRRSGSGRSARWRSRSAASMSTPRPSAPN
jgi:hypothetical protein